MIEPKIEDELDSEGSHVLRVQKRDERHSAGVLEYYF